MREAISKDREGSCGGCKELPTTPKLRHVRHETQAALRFADSEKKRLGRAAASTCGDQRKKKKGGKEPLTEREKEEGEKVCNCSNPDYASSGGGYALKSEPDRR